MKTIGLLGGMSWESTLGYYRAINEGVKKSLGGLHSAKIVMFSVDFEPIEKLQHAGDWEGTAKILSKAARNVESAGDAGWLNFQTSWGTDINTFFNFIGFINRSNNPC